MRLPWALRCLGAHRWRQTSIPRCNPSWVQKEWVCLTCHKRTVRNITEPPIILLLSGEPYPGHPDPYDEVLPL